MLKFLSISLTLLTLSQASIEIYQDRARLSLIPTGKFIGFNAQVKATDALGDLKIVKGSCENSKLLVCNSVNKIEKLKAQNSSLKMQKSILEKSLNRFETDAKDAKQTITYIQKLSNEIISVQKSIQKNSYLIEQEKNRQFLASKKPYFLNLTTSKKIDLEFRGISFSSAYELNVKKAELKHKINFINRSGIEIKTTDAHLLDRRLVGISPNRKFQPKFIYINRPQEMKRVAKKSAPQRLMQADSVEGLSISAVVSKESARNYTIKNFSLATDGLKKSFTVERKKVDLSHSLQWNVWENRVFEVLRVVYDEVLEVNYLNINYKNSMIKNVPIRRDGKELFLNIAQVYDIEAVREKIPDFSKEKGIFHSDRYIQNGYKLLMTNLSTKAKKVNVIEKIPLSRDEKIEVELKGVWELKGNEKKKIDFKYESKTGKLELDISLQANEKRVFEYIYIIKHPEDMKVHY